MTISEAQERYEARKNALKFNSAPPLLPRKLSELRKFAESLCAEINGLRSEVVDAHFKRMEAERKLADAQTEISRLQQAVRVTAEATADLASVIKHMR